MDNSGVPNGQIVCTKCLSYLIAFGKKYPNGFFSVLMSLAKYVW